MEVAGFFGVVAEVFGGSEAGFRPIAALDLGVTASGMTLAASIGPQGGAPIAVTRFPGRGSVAAARQTVEDLRRARAEHFTSPDLVGARAVPTPSWAARFPDVTGLTAGFGIGRVARRNAG